MSDPAVGSRKPKKQRSPSYPAIDLQAALARAEQLHAREGRHWAPVVAVLDAWGYNPKSSGGLLAIAALKRYGLLDDRGALGRAGVAVAHRDGDRLLQRRDVPHLGVLPERVEEPLLDRAGVPEHVRDAVGEQLLDDREASCLAGHRAAQVAAPTALGWKPHCLRPVSSTSTIFWPVRYESGVERPVTNG